MQQQTNRRDYSDILDAISAIIDNKCVTLSKLVTQEMSEMLDCKIQLSNISEPNHVEYEVTLPNREHYDEGEISYTRTYNEGDKLNSFVFDISDIEGLPDTVEISATTEMRILNRDILKHLHLWENVYQSQEARTDKELDESYSNSTLL